MHTCLTDLNRFHYFGATNVPISHLDMSWCIVSVLFYIYTTKKSRVKRSHTHTNFYYLLKKPQYDE